MKKVSGTCRICGREGKLTFEHIPPGATYNKQSVRIVQLMDLIKAENSKDAYPWELNRARSTISQRGRGEYCLCEMCNNNTGSWYGVHYKRFIDAFMYIYMNEMKDDSICGVTLELKGVRPLPIIKQVFTMFCDINPSLTTNDPSVREFLLNKESNAINKSKYRIFMYLMTGSIEKTVGFTALLKLGCGSPILLSEIAAVPVGFILYEDLPSDYETGLTEITSFIDCDYSYETTITMSLHIKEVNSWLPSDFRSKDEIIATIEENKKWKEDNSNRL